jgi:hypothetical protein
LLPRRGNASEFAGAIDRAAIAAGLRPAAPLHPTAEKLATAHFRYLL